MAIPKTMQRITAATLTAALGIGCFSAACAGVMTCTSEADAQTVNSKAMTAYKAKVAQLKKESSKSGIFTAQYADLDGDGVKELRCVYKPNSMTGSGFSDIIFTYKNGKIKKVFKYQSAVIANKITYSKKSNSFAYKMTGKGAITVSYYQLKDGKYKFVAEKMRLSTKVGATENTGWSYSVNAGKGAAKIVKKTKFKKAIANLQQGKLRTLTY